MKVYIPTDSDVNGPPAIFSTSEAATLFSRLTRGYSESDENDCYTVDPLSLEELRQGIIIWHVVLHASRDKTDAWVARDQKLLPIARCRERTYVSVKAAAYGHAIGKAQKLVKEKLGDCIHTVTG